MEILTILIPVSLLLGGVGLVAFFWALRRGQFDDPDGYHDSPFWMKPDADTV